MRTSSKIWEKVNDSQGIRLFKTPGKKKQVDDHGIVVWYDPEGHYQQFVKSWTCPALPWRNTMSASSPCVTESIPLFLTAIRPG